MKKELNDDVPVVFGKGPKTAELMIIGEAPGAEEVAAKAPFVGRAGKLLTTMLSSAKIDRSEVYITNVVKEPCREGNKNRPPKRWEIEKWKDLLWEELKSLDNLKIIITLGKVPTSLLLRLPASFKLGDYVGKRYNREYTKADIVPMLHPSYLLNSSAEDTRMTIKTWKLVYNMYIKQKISSPETKNEKGNIIS